MGPPPLITDRPLCACAGGCRSQSDGTPRAGRPVRWANRATRQGLPVEQGEERLGGRFRPVVGDAPGAHPGTPLPTHQAAILVFDSANGAPAALLDGTAITAARTAACSALSARLLAREDATLLAVLGTGVQARSHIRAMCRVRPIREVRIAGRVPAKAAGLAAELSAELDVDVRAVPTYVEALDGAHIAAATTHALEPVVRRPWLTPGVHVTSVGYNPDGREFDDATIADALVCVESRQAALAPFPAGSNDLLMPIRHGVITPEHVHAELGELISGHKPGRTSPTRITLYKSVGVAVQDAVAAALVVAAARMESVGAHATLE
ncbi:ornithine cyclodeaminase family protein [Streptomyces sp. NPDC048558]|uniref:ornithine cyclodeaminase family protein n=1 Tax=Streptomyces sp. NPDC048558 TaxID=3155759 RepID=UPI00342BA340